MVPQVLLLSPSASGGDEDARQRQQLPIFKETPLFRPRQKMKFLRAKTGHETQLDLYLQSFSLPQKLPEPHTSGLIDVVIKSPGQSPIFA